MPIDVSARNCCLALSVALSLALSSHSAQAQTRTRLKGKVLYSFDATGTHGANPNGALVQDAQGRLYGVTFNGGGAGQGTIFRLTRPASGTGPWTEEVLFNFEDDLFGSVKNGENPSDGLAIDQAGTVYGTTEFGGAYGYGIVFSLNPSTRVYTILHSFRSPTTDGVEPLTGLTFGPGGLLYGTTSSGGYGTLPYPNGTGTVFSISPLGDNTEYAIIHYFQAKDDTDGVVPNSRLLSDGTSKFFGTSQSDGGSPFGIVYSLNLAAGGNWVETVLYHFQGGFSDLSGPSGSGDLARGPQGTLYGTAGSGGLYNAGGIYQLTPPAAAGSPWQETILHVNNPSEYDFQGLKTLILQQGAGGQLLGTGAFGGGKTGTGQGGIFQLTPPAVAGGAWAYNELYVLGTPPYGAFPSGPLMRHGKSYAGVTGASLGGTGTVFEFQLKTVP